jgi:hypothetical protein
MADTALVRTGLDTLIAENWSSTVIDNLADITPLLAAMITRNGQNKKSVEGLGIPDSGMVLTGVKGAKVRKKEILSSFVYQPMIHHLLPAEGDGKVMGVYDSLPTRSDWENSGPERRFKRPAVKWCEIADPCKVPAEIVRHTKRTAAGERNGWEAIGDLFKVENSDVLTRHLTRWSQMLWGSYTGTANGASTSGAPSNEDDDKWDAIYSVKNAVGSTTNTYCGVDRSVSGNSYWHGNLVSTTTAPVFRDMIRYANYGTPGLAKKNKGLDAIFVGATLFQYALAEADAKGGQIIRAGEAIPDFGQFGWKRDLVKIDNTYVVFDPGCPAGDAFGVSFKTWTLAIHPDANFKQSTPKYLPDYNEGADDAFAWEIRTKIMLVCEDPSGNVFWDDVQ